jgi:hypothetical protein
MWKALRHCRMLKVTAQYLTVATCLGHRLQDIPPDCVEDRLRLPQVQLVIQHPACLEQLSHLTWPTRT